MAANEKALGALHTALATALATALKGTELDGYMDPDTGEEVPGQVMPPSAAIMTVAAKFLKDNNITCEPAEDNELGELERIMRDRQANLRKVDDADRQQIAKDMGFMH